MASTPFFLIDFYLTIRYNITMSVETFQEPKFNNISNIKNPPDGSCDNSLLFTGTLLVLLTELTLHKFYEDEINHFCDDYEKFVLACQVEPGLYHRYPGWDYSMNSHDDLTGVAVASYFYQLPFAKDIYEHGKKNWWIFNNQNPGKLTKETWLYRIPDFVPTIKACAGLNLNLWNQFMFSLALIANLFENKQETSGKILIYLKQKVVKGKGFFSDLVIKLWRWRMQKLYPNGMQDVFTIYFGSDHVITQLAQKDFS